MDQHETSPETGAVSVRAGQKRALIAELSSVVALGVSFLALSIGAYQARLMNMQTQLMQSQARASVWPYISIGYSLRDEGEKTGYAWEIINDGVGPARIESVTLSLDGKPVQTWKEVFHALFGDEKVLATYSRINGKVLPPDTNRDTTIEAVRIPALEQAKVFYAAQDRLKMTICYCSVYDECWIANRQDPKTKKVDRCETSGTVQFEEKL